MQHLDQDSDHEVFRLWMTQLIHQLMSPLHGLQGYAENIQRRLEQWNNKTTYLLEKENSGELNKLRYDLEAIIWATHYAARLADNLAWVSFGNGKPAIIEIEIENDVGGLLIRSARDFQGIARYRGIYKVWVDTDAASALNNRLYVDRSLFRQAFGNLLDNAVKYAYKDTEIIISSRITTSTAIISVTNEGIELPESEMEKIFEEGYRAAQAINHNAPGTGIGLKVARDIIRLHQGELRALPSIPTSTKGQWKTVFEIELPLLK